MSVAPNRSPCTGHHFGRPMIGIEQCDVLRTDDVQERRKLRVPDQVFESLVAVILCCAI
jgi:hypothetical protein